MTAQAILSKTTKVSERCLPKTSAFYDDYSSTMSAKVRKAGRVAELSAMGDAWIAQDPSSNSYKLVGAGSYQRVVFYVTTHTAGRERFRGTCQACAGGQIVDEHGLIVLHGYLRPGHGYVVNRCVGVGSAPAETSIELARTIIRDCTETAATYEKLLAALPVLPPFRMDMSDAVKKARIEAEKVRRDYGNAIWSNKTLAAHLTAHALPQIGRPLATEVVAS